jgi:hypothetical protein
MTRRPFVVIFSQAAGTQASNDGGSALRIGSRSGGQAPGAQGWASRGFALIAVAVAASACASAPPAPVRPIDAGQVALSAERASALDVPYRLVFEWSFDELGTRLQGRGVARIEPPFNARLDLFLSNGETAAVAALVGDDLRFAEGGQAELPASPLLWAALGVFRPGGTSALMGGSWSPAGLAELTYASETGGTLLYQLQGDRIVGIDVVRAERRREELRLLQAEGDRFPQEATYRHLDEVRELRITLESVEHVESYPSDIWNPAS